MPRPLQKKTPTLPQTFGITCYHSQNKSLCGVMKNKAMTKKEAKAKAKKLQDKADNERAKELARYGKTGETHMLALVPVVQYSVIRLTANYRGWVGSRQRSPESG
jgi:hypothetical protein